MLGLYCLIKVVMTEQNQDSAAFLPGVFSRNCAYYTAKYTQQRPNNQTTYCNWAIVCEYQVSTQIPIFCTSLRRIAGKIRITKAPSSAMASRNSSASSASSTPSLQGNMFPNGKTVDGSEILHQLEHI